MAIAHLSVAFRLLGHLREGQGAWKSRVGVGRRKDLTLSLYIVLPQDPSMSVFLRHERGCGKAVDKPVEGWSIAKLLGVKTSGIH